MNFKLQGEADADKPSSRVVRLVPSHAQAPKPYVIEDVQEGMMIDHDSHYRLAAGGHTFYKLSEPERMNCLKLFLEKLSERGGDIFTREYQWMAVYRIAADCGLTIDHDYTYFTDKVMAMNVQGLPKMFAPARFEKLDQRLYAPL